MQYRLSVDRGHVLQGLRLFKRTRRKTHRPETAIIGFDGRCLTLEAQGTTMFAQAIGAWPGNAHVSAMLVTALAEVPPADDPIIVSFADGYLHFGPLKVGCKWQPVSSALLALPATRDWVQALAISYQRSRGDILADGLTDEVRAAHQQLGKLIQRVAKSLAPLGVTAADIQQLVERRLEERYVHRP